MGTPASRAVNNAVNNLSTSFAALSCTTSEEPCMPIRRPQTPCPGLPGGRGITMEVPTKDLCQVRPSSEASMSVNVTRRTCVPRAMAMLESLTGLLTVNARFGTGVNSHICQHVTHPAYPLCIPVQTQPLGPRPTTATVRFSRSFGKNAAFAGQNH